VVDEEVVAGATDSPPSHIHTHTLLRDIYILVLSGRETAAGRQAGAWTPDDHRPTDLKRKRGREGSRPTHCLLGRVQKRTFVRP
jgi:hypothetical protein